MGQTSGSFVPIYCPITSSASSGEILTTATYPYGVSTLLQSPSLLNHIPLAQILPRQCERHNLAPSRRNLNLLKPMELSDWSTWDIKV